MQRLWMAITPGPLLTRIVVMDGACQTILQARLPPSCQGFFDGLDSLSKIDEPLRHFGGIHTILRKYGHCQGFETFFPGHNRFCSPLGPIRQIDVL